MMRLPILLVCVLTIPDVWTKPTAETTPTTPRYNLTGGYQSPDTPKAPTNPLFFPTNGRRSKAPKNEAFFEDVRKLSNKKRNRVNNSNNKGGNHDGTFRIRFVAPNAPKVVNVSTKNAVRVKNKTTLRPVKLKVKRVSTKRPFVSSTSRSVVVKRKKPNLTEQMRKNYTTVSVSTTNNKHKKPVVHKVISKWSEKPYINEIKQSWYDVPSVNPQPEIISYSPESSISDAPLSSSPTPTSEDTISIPSADTNPLNQFKIDVLPRPSTNQLANAAQDAASSPQCPEVHISSAMSAPFSPQAKQGCSDISVVLNSVFNQNPTVTLRTPQGGEEIAPEAVEAEEPLADAPAEAPAPQADPPAAADPPVADAPAAGAESAGGGGQQGAGGGPPGLPSLPEAPELPMMPEFDLKGMMDFLNWIGGGLGHILRFFKNPWLYIVPFVLSFILGFKVIIGLFPWWVPALALYAGWKSKSSKDVTYYKHVHKPVVHPDGWFWNHNTKTWNNVLDYHHHRYHPHHTHRSFDSSSLNLIPKLIEDYTLKYRNLSENSQTWKRRKKNN